MDLKTRYVIKGLGKEQIISSKIMIGWDETTGKIEKVEDKWDGKLPDSGFADVSDLRDLFNPWWWVRYGEGWAWWFWSFTWDMRWWQVRLWRRNEREIGVGGARQNCSLTLGRFLVF